MDRTEILNIVIKNNGYKSYLEIGVAVPTFNFDLIECETKEGCDPYEDDDYYYDFEQWRVDYYRKTVTYCMRSDDMFSVMPKDKKYDIIFVDGYHTEEQTKRDIVNSMKHLNEGGTIAVHDVIPRGEIFSRDDRVTDEWYGGAYKAIMDLGKIGARYSCVKQDGSNGVALIPYQNISAENEAEYLKKSEYTWADFESDTVNRMHIINVDDYKKKIMIYHNSKYISQEEKGGANRRFDSHGNIVFGGTEFWVTGIADSLSKWCFDVFIFTDTILHSPPEGVSYVQRDSKRVYEHFDAAIVTTDIEVTNSLDCDTVILIPTCEYFNTDFGEFARAEYVGMLSEWQKNLQKKAYFLPDNLLFRHFLPCRYDLYENYAEYEKENAMVWSSSPIRGLRFFIERVFPKIKHEIPDFRLYICGYNDDYYEEEWPKYVEGVMPMINASREELAELQKKAKIWVYPNIGRSETSGFFNETYCITSVENALAGNAIVCFDKKDGIESTLEGYEGFLDGNMFNEYDPNFMYYYEVPAKALADRAIEILKDDTLRKSLAESARNICKGYTWEKETEIILDKILGR